MSENKEIKKKTQKLWSCIGKHIWSHKPSPTQNNSYPWRARFGEAVSTFPVPWSFRKQTYLYNTIASFKLEHFFNVTMQSRSKIWVQSVAIKVVSMLKWVFTLTTKGRPRTQLSNIDMDSSTHISRLFQHQCWDASAGLLWWENVLLFIYTYPRKASICISRLDCLSFLERKAHWALQLHL